MLITEMHYDFKKKLNKLDSQQNRNLLVPEIDWTLNEAEQIFVKLIAFPRLKNNLGFETSQRTIDDIRSVVMEGVVAPVVDDIITLPPNYNYLVKSYLNITKSNCPLTRARLYIKQHDDEFEESYFDKSSYEWREVNGCFISTGIKCYKDNSFTISNASLTYIRKRAFMHNAQSFGTGSYISLSGVSLTGSVNCELPESTHGEIVDIAVMLAAGEIQLSSFDVKLNKLKINQII